MNQFQQHNQEKTWPSSTNIHCFWCCHHFDNLTPCTLPVQKKESHYIVFGCFCSPECAAAYNFHEGDDTQEIWNRYSLLNLLYKNVYACKNLKIKLAPPRSVLKMFGGTLTIKEFREYNINYGRKISVNMPPMLSITQQIEETNTDNKNEYKKKFIPLDDVRVKNADINLRLKRKTPVSVSQNTLENCMSLKYI